MTTLTLKNIPDEIYQRLRRSAERHRRSLNREAIVCLEAALAPANLPPEERIARARALRRELPEGAFTASVIDAHKRAGRA